MPDNSLLIRAGKALWGENWRSEMASALNVRKDAVEDWRQGRMSPRNGVYVDLLRIMVERTTALDGIADEIHAILERAP